MEGAVNVVSEVSYDCTVKGSDNGTRCSQCAERSYEGVCLGWGLDDMVMREVVAQSIELDV